MSKQRVSWLPGVQVPDLDHARRATPQALPDSHRQGLSVWGDCETLATCGFLKRRNELPRYAIPAQELARSVVVGVASRTARGIEELTVARKRQSIHGRYLSHDVRLQVSPDPPELHSAVRASRCQDFPIGREGEGMNRIGMPSQGSDLAQTVPETNEVVVASGGQKPAVRRVGQGRQGHASKARRYRSSTRKFPSLEHTGVIRDG